MLDEMLIYEILSVVEEIPEGQVATYGQIAKLIGRDKNARLVGKVLSMSQFYGQYPCHRVVNHCGRLVPGWHEQSFLLCQEGVVLKSNHHVDLRKYQWNC
ncbi:MGMT family protein [Lachnoclostridium edouardi]|uniref:MGMT family protein n=1 Tax=Lachnoclostridium edouardi TaxID=1926283 RepID=UPI000C7E8535|nr:MGMT family protein [Lachnoclostridium edouardi]